MAAPTNSILISALADGVTANTADQIPINRAGADAYITPNYIKTFVGAQPSNAILTSLAALTFAVGDIVYANGAASLTNLADVAVGNVLRAGGVGVAPAWGKAVLTTDVTGILPSANGGTGVNNAGTITNASNTTITGGGTLALGGFTLTVPATGSAALLATANVFTAAQAITIADSVTNTTTTLATFTHNSSGTPAPAFGSRLLFNLDSATVDDRNAIAIDATWLVSTDATRGSYLSVSAVTAGGALTEAIRVLSSGIQIKSGTALTISTSDRKAVEDGGAASVRYGEGYTGGEIRPGGTAIIKWSSTPTLGFFNIGPVAKQTGGANLTNSVTSGGVDDTITNWTDLTTYATDAAAIRNAVYQLARTLKQDHDALRAYGLLT